MANIRPLSACSREIQSIDRPNGRLIDRSTDWLTDRLSDWPTDRMADRLIDRPTKWPSDRPNGRPTDWLTDRLLTDRLTPFFGFLSRKFKSGSRRTSSARTWRTSNMTTSYTCWTWWTGEGSQADVCWYLFPPTSFSGSLLGRPWERGCLPAWKWSHFFEMVIRHNSTILHQQIVFRPQCFVHVYCLHPGMLLFEFRNAMISIKDQMLKKPNHDGKDWRRFYRSLPNFGYSGIAKMAAAGSCAQALATRYSQLKPTRAKLQNQNLHRRVANRHCQVEPARKKTIQLSDYDRAPNNNKTTWWELALVAKRWKMWLELGENFSLIKFKPTRSNSSQVSGQTIPNLARVGLSWEYRLARA